MPACGHRGALQGEAGGCGCRAEFLLDGARPRGSCRTPVRRICLAGHQQVRAWAAGILSAGCVGRTESTRGFVPGAGRGPDFLPLSQARIPPRQTASSKSNRPCGAASLKAGSRLGARWKRSGGPPSARPASQGEQPWPGAWGGSGCKRLTTNGMAGMGQPAQDGRTAADPDPDALGPREDSLLSGEEISSSRPPGASAGTGRLAGLRRQD